MTTPLLVPALLALGLLSSAGVAAAQTPDAAPPALDDPNTIPAPPEQACADEATGEPQTCDTLSEQLGATGGVISPPTGIDPDITAPAPDPTPGTTPVIPPSAVPQDSQAEPPVIEQ